MGLPGTGRPVRVVRTPSPEPVPESVPVAPEPVKVPA